MASIQGFGAVQGFVRRVLIYSDADVCVIDCDWNRGGIVNGSESEAQPPAEGIRVFDLERKTATATVHHVLFHVVSTRPGMRIGDSG